MNLIYKYGLLPPVVNATLVREQMRLGHDYRNTLTEIERGRRSAQRALALTHGDIAALTVAASDADAAVGAASIAVKAAKADARSRSVPIELREALTSARLAKRDANNALREARRAARGALSEESRAIDERAYELSTNAYNHTAACWGTRQLGRMAIDAAKKKPLYDGAEPNDPKFRRWAGDGSIGVQVQGDPPTDALFRGASKFLRIETIAHGAHVADDGRRHCNRQPPGKHRGERQFAKLWMRVGSNKRDPVWAVWPMALHRPLPAGATVKRAQVSVRKVGPVEEWSVQISVRGPETSREARGGIVALDLGWRQMPGGAIRVGYWVGDDGGSGEIVIDATSERLAGDAPPTSHGLVDRLRHPEAIQSTRMMLFDAARAGIEVRLASIDSIPEWLRAATGTLAQWRSPARLAALARRWRSARFDGDAEAYEKIEAWRYKDHHLWSRGDEAHRLSARGGHDARVRKLRRGRRMGPIVERASPLRIVWRDVGPRRERGIEPSPCVRRAAA